MAILMVSRDSIHREVLRLASTLIVWLALFGVPVHGQRVDPVLNTVFPAGGQAGTTVVVELEGTGLDGLREVRTTVPGLTGQKVDARRFSLEIPEGAPSGTYDLWAVGLHGVSSPRSFVVSDRAEILEVEPNDTPATPQKATLNSVIEGRIGKPSDIDVFQFQARAGQRIVVECFVERIDSKLRPVLEVYDAQNKRLAVSRGYAGIDPLVDFVAPAEGTYFLRLFDLSYLGSSAHFYRLELDSQPRVECTHPCVLQRGTKATVKLFGRNLSEARPGSKPRLDELKVELSAPRTVPDHVLPMRQLPSRIGVEAFSYQLPGRSVSIPIGWTNVPVIPGEEKARDLEHAQAITVPCEVSAQMNGEDDRQWYAIRASRGEVFWLEVFGARLGSPVDLDLLVLDAKGEREVFKGARTLENVGGYRFPLAHNDSAGRWVAPEEGQYLILVRNLIGGLERDPRRIYRLSVRREEPDFALAVVSRRTDQPAGFNIARGGRTALDVFVVRKRGFAGPIRVANEKTLPGVHCPDIWIGPEQDRGVVVLSADPEALETTDDLKLVGEADWNGLKLKHQVRAGTMIWSGQTMPSGRLMQASPFAVAGQATARLTVAPTEAVVDQESVLDLTFDLEGTLGKPLETDSFRIKPIGLPRPVSETVAMLAAGQTKGPISLLFPASLPPGPYTFALQAEAIQPKGGKSTVSLVSQPITVQVRPGRIALEVDPGTPRKIRRGQIIQLRFSAERRHGFLGKIHTELVAPGGVVGMRARGVTFVGQTDSGSLQVIATDDAPLGKVPFLRLDAVGTVEDQPVFRGSRFVDLEIIE